MLPGDGSDHGGLAVGRRRSCHLDISYRLAAGLGNMIGSAFCLGVSRALFDATGSASQDRTWAGAGTRSRVMFLSMFFWAVLLTPSSLGLGHNPEGKPATGTHTPAWTVDLRSVGFTGFAPKGEQWGLHLRPNPLCFADRRTLIATFITREDVTTLARRDQPGETLPLGFTGFSWTRMQGRCEPRRSGRLRVLGVESLRLAVVISSFLPPQWSRYIRQVSSW